MLPLPGVSISIRKRLASIEEVSHGQIQTAHIAGNQNSISACPRGLLLQDYQLIDKLMHQNRERIAQAPFMPGAGLQALRPGISGNIAGDRQHVVGIPAPGRQHRPGAMTVLYGTA